ncbi:hypothetical protein IRJ41_016586, partial [Triplophysa rosa]
MNSGRYPQDRLVRLTDGGRGQRREDDSNADLRYRCLVLRDMIPHVGPPRHLDPTSAANLSDSS